MVPAAIVAPSRLFSHAAPVALAPTESLIQISSDGFDQELEKVLYAIYAIIQEAQDEANKEGFDSLCHSGWDD